MSGTTTSPYLAGEPGDCCIKGLKHEGESVGRIETIAGIQTYVSEPPAATTGRKKIILFFADVFGSLFNNSKLLQDYFASFGFLVLGPDYHFGDYVQDNKDKPNFDLQAWADQKLAVAKEKTPKWIETVREIYGEDAQYFSTGYCFGGPFTVEMAATDKVSASAFAHPAWVTEEHFRNLKKPFLLSCAEEDFTFPPDARHKAEEILAEIKATYYVEVFSGVQHGFATRADLSDANARWAREQSAQSIINWFRRFSSN